jgi:hypothetical protein
MRAIQRRPTNLLFSLTPPVSERERTEKKQPETKSQTFKRSWAAAAAASWRLQRCEEIKHQIHLPERSSSQINNASGANYRT